MQYIAYLHKDKKSDYGVSFPDFPGCVTAGKTLAGAQKLAHEALEAHIEGMIEEGEALPEPSTLDDLAGDPARKDAVVILVNAEVSEKAGRFNITARKSQMEKTDALARKRGMTRSAYMVVAALGEGGKSSRSRR